MTRLLLLPAAADRGRGELYRMRIEVIPDLPAVAVVSPPDRPR